MPEFRTRLDGSEATIHFTDVGHGPAVLLVHGFPLDGRIWDDVVPLLSPTCRVIVPDLPGFGRSALERAIFSMESLAGALDRLMQSLEVESALCVGLSMGGYVIQALMRSFPLRVKALSFVDTRANADDDAGKTARNKMIDVANQHGTPGVVEQMLPKMLHPDTFASDSVTVVRLKNLMLEQAASTIAAACGAMRDRDDFTDDLAILGCPLQVIVGESDLIAPPGVAIAMHQKAKKSRLDVIRGAGHMAPIERPEAVGRVLVEFIGEVMNAE